MNTNRAHGAALDRQYDVSRLTILILIATCCIAACGERSVEALETQRAALSSTPIATIPPAPVVPAYQQVVTSNAASSEPIQTAAPVWVAPIDFRVIHDVTLTNCNEVLRFGIPAGQHWWLIGQLAENQSCRIVVSEDYTDIVFADVTYSVTILHDQGTAFLAQHDPTRYADCNMALQGAEFYLDNLRLRGSLNYSVGCAIYQFTNTKLIRMDDGMAVLFAVSR